MVIGPHFVKPRRWTNMDAAFINLDLTIVYS